MTSAIPATHGHHATKEKQMEDMVNKPPHYADLFTTKPTQCRAIARMLGFDPGNVVKYVWRAGTKAPEKTVEDLQKAVNYLKDWQELYDILWEKDIGNYEAARAIFAQLEEPDDPVAFRKWDIIRAILRDKGHSQEDASLFFAYIRNSIASLCVTLTGERLP